MTTVSFPNQEDLEEQAVSWIASIDRGLDEQEQSDLDAWLEESPFHGEALVQCASMWDLLDVLQPIAKLMPIDQTLVESQKVPLQASNDTVWIKQAMVGCSLLLFVSVLTFFNLPVQEVNSIADRSSVIEQPLNTKIYSTEVGERSVIPLSDGSILELNTNSVVEVNFTESKRNIELIKGEVYFDVAKDPSKPFVVKIGEDKVTAIGTAFSIDAGHLGRLKKSLSEIIVTEGKVSVISGGQTPLYLVSGQKITVDDNTHKITDNTDSDSLLAWREGVVVFEGESLTHVIREIDRYTPLKFIIKDEELASISVGGLFKTGDLTQLLLVLENNFGVISQQIGDEIILSKAN